MCKLWKTCTLLKSASHSLHYGPYNMRSMSTKPSGTQNKKKKRGEKKRKYIFTVVCDLYLVLWYNGKSQHHLYSMLRTQDPVKDSYSYFTMS